jgi:WD40-like Beta Propeller Repeat
MQHMNRFPVIAVSIVVAGILFAGFAIAHQHGTAQRLRHKAALAEAGVKSMASDGADPSAILTVMDQVKLALDSHDIHRAESLLDRALAMLAQESRRAPPENDSPLPVFTAKENESNLFDHPERVTIDGYEGSAMEPFLSPDGHFLFFNNENDPKVNTNLHFAERISSRSFHYLGELPGVNTASLDAVPSIDSAGHFYFTALREYDRTKNSIFIGDFNGRQVTNLRPAPGNITPTGPFTVNMDASISPDGQTLYISRAVIFPGAPAPKKSELMVARLRDGVFNMAPNSAEIMKNINAGALEYAPAISANGLELYFTRASQLKAGPTASGAKLRILVATRSSLQGTFGEPQVLKALEGYVEAPSISLDGRELFFHKKIGDKFVIYHAVRTVR